MNQPPMPAHNQAGPSSLPSITPPSAAICPRCRGGLAILCPVSRRARGITARLCPSLSCGYRKDLPCQIAKKGPGFSRGDELAPLHEGKPLSFGGLSRIGAP